MINKFWMTKKDYAGLLPMPLVFLIAACGAIFLVCGLVMLVVSYKLDVSAVRFKALGCILTGMIWIMAAWNLYVSTLVPVTCLLLAALAVNIMCIIMAFVPAGKDAL